MHSLKVQDSSGIMKLITHPSEKAQVSTCSGIESVSAQTAHINRECSDMCSFLKSSIKAVQAQVAPHPNHTGVLQSVLTVTAQEWRLCTKLETKGLVLSQCVFLLPTFLSSSAKIDTVLPSAQIQQRSFLPPH